MENIKDYSVYRPPDPPGGIISVSCNSVYVLIGSRSVKAVSRRVKSSIYKGSFQFPYFCEQYALGEAVKVEIVKYCKEERVDEELYKMKLQYISLGRRLLNQDIIQVWDNIVPFRYQSLFKKIVNKLNKGEINEEFLQNIIRTKL